MKIPKRKANTLFQKIVKAIITENFYTWIKCGYVRYGLSFLIQREEKISKCTTKYRIILDDNINDFCVEFNYLWGDSKSSIYKALGKEFKEIIE